MQHLALLAMILSVSACCDYQEKQNTTGKSPFEKKKKLKKQKMKMQKIL